MWHIPNNIIDRSYKPKIASAESNRIVTINLTVLKHKPSRRRGLPYKITCIDETGEIDLIWFNARRQYLEEILPIGSNLTISGKIETYKKRKQIIHPQHIIKEDDKNSFQEIEPVYRLTQGLTNKVLRNYINKALEITPYLPEWHDQELIKRMNWPNFNKAIKDIHNPKNLDEVDPKLIETYNKLGIPLNEQKRLSGIAVDAVFDSVSVATTFKDELTKKGIIFCPISELSLIHI